MDINALRVFDSIYKLELTEKDYEQLEVESNDFEKTGLYIQTIKKDNAICVSHDDKHKIIIKKLDTISGIKLVPRSRVMFKTLIKMVNLPEEIYTLHQIAQYRALDKRIKFVANNLEQLKDRICDRFTDDHPKNLGDMYEDLYYDSETREKNSKLRPALIEKQLKAIYWLFDEEYKEEIVESRPNIPKIIKVFSRNNRRLAIFQEVEDYEKQRGGCMYGNRYSEHVNRVVFKIKTYKPKNPEYNYVSPNREMYIPDSWGENCSIWIDDDMYERLTPGELKVFSKTIEDDDEFYLLNADKYNKQKEAIRLELLSAKRKELEEQAEHQLKARVTEQFKNGKVVRQGITFTKKSMSYEGFEIKSNMLGQYLNGYSVLEQKEPNFNEIFCGFVDYVLKPEVHHSQMDWSDTTVGFQFEGKAQIQVNKVKITIEKIKNNVFVNDKRIRIIDVSSVVKDALNYKSQEEYDKWLQYTGRVNLTLQKALKDGGLQFELRFDNTDDNDLTTGYNSRDTTKMLLSIPIRREDNGKLFATIKDKEYKVKHTQSLFDLTKDIDSCRMGRSGGGYLQRTIKLLYRAVDGLSPKEIGEVIKEGKKEYLAMVKKIRKSNEIKIKKSQDFIKHAVKITKAERTKDDDGYIVKGLSGMVYYVGDNMSVHTVKNNKSDKYLCIVDDWVDDEGEEWRTNDRVAKRLLALSKDQKVAKEIYDNGDHVDKHWLDIMEE